MKQYLDLCRKILGKGVTQHGRNGHYKSIQGECMRFDMRDGFPLVTTREMNFNAIVAELLGFILGTTSAAKFRELGTKIWDANANVNEQWRNNPNRTGEDDLGRIYGAQWRGWRKYESAYPDSFDNANEYPPYTDEFRVSKIDQLKNVIDDLRQHQDNRREIVLAWNPAELEQMALPPCHLLFQFGIGQDRDGRKSLNLGMYQRSCDFALGIPFNIASYSLLLHIVAAMTGLVPGVFTHFLWDCHIYFCQIDLMEYQLNRSPRALPALELPSEIKSGELAIDDIPMFLFENKPKLKGYNPHPNLNYPFSV